MRSFPDMHSVHPILNICWKHAFLYISSLESRDSVLAASPKVGNDEARNTTQELATSIYSAFIPRNKPWMLQDSYEKGWRLIVYVKRFELMQSISIICHDETDSHGTIVAPVAAFELSRELANGLLLGLHSKKRGPNSSRWVPWTETEEREREEDPRSQVWRFVHTCQIHLVVASAQRGSSLMLASSRNWQFSFHYILCQTIWVDQTHTMAQSHPTILQPLLQPLDLDMSLPLVSAQHTQSWQQQPHHLGSVPQGGTQHIKCLCCSRVCKTVYVCQKGGSSMWARKLFHSCLLLPHEVGILCQKYLG